MTDRELLEAAAKAAGMKATAWVEGYGDYYWQGPTSGLQIEGCNGVWNPLEDDADALRLAVKLGIDLCFGNDKVCADGGHERYTGRADGAAKDADRCAATRRAIVRAAAAMAK